MACSKEFGPDRYIILEKSMTYDVSEDGPMFCPFIKDGKCKGRNCMMFVDIFIRDKTEPDGMLWRGTSEGRCGLVNIPVQSRMYFHFNDDETEDEEYFVGDFNAKTSDKS